MEALLGRCLNSFIIEKEYMEMLEIIVVNDGSKDNSSKIAHEYAEKYPNAYIVIDKQNGNYGSCINAAMKVATGKYFKICDADDRYETSNLKEFLAFLKKMDTDIVFSPFSTLTNRGALKETVECFKSVKEKVYFIDDINWSDKKIMEFRAMHCMAVKTEILRCNQYEQTEGISYTDTQFSFYSLLYSNTCSFFDKTIYLYYLGRDEQTMSPISMKRTHYHFYLNADRLVDTYCNITTSLSMNKQIVLFNCIFIETLFFVEGFLGNFANVDKQIALLKALIEKSKKTNKFCPLEDSLLKSSRKYKLLTKYHFRPAVIFLLRFFQQLL